jgi:hypothetical protein
LRDFLLKFVVGEKVVDIDWRLEDVVADPSKAKGFEELKSAFDYSLQTRRLMDPEGILNILTSDDREFTLDQVGLLVSQMEIVMDRKKGFKKKEREGYRGAVSLIRMMWPTSQEK